MKVKYLILLLIKRLLKDLEDKKLKNLDDGLKICDYLSLHVPLNEKTKNLIDYFKLRI